LSADPIPTPTDPAPVDPALVDPALADSPPTVARPGLSATARLIRLAFGDPALRPLSVAHFLASAADAFIAVSLARSLFFNLSPDASRKQVLLYLFVAVAPLAVLAPLIGPAVDRFRKRQRVLASVCYGLRALFCLALAGSLLQLSFYGFALGLLVIGKASGIVKQALVPLLVPDPEHLVSANALLARLSGIAGAIGGGVALVLLRNFGPGWLLGSAAIVFVAAGVAICFMRPLPGPDVSLTEVEYAELHLPTVVVGGVGVMAIRAAVGFFVFTLAFTLRRASEPAWVYGVAIVLYGAGTFAGNIVAPVLRRRFQDHQLIALALAAPTIPIIIGILGVSRPLLLAVAALIGLSTTLGRNGFDSLLQHRAPVALRGRAAARYETRFQLLWAVGGLLATPIAFPTEASMAVLTALYVPALIVFLRASNAAQIFEDSSLDVYGRAERRLVQAEQSLMRGEFRVAIIDASAAIDLARVAAVDTDGTHPTAEVDRMRVDAVTAAVEVTEDDARRAVSTAQALLSLGRPRSKPSP